MHRSVKGWTSDFGRFVSDYGVPALVRDLAAQGEPVIPSTVYKWMAGAAQPRPQLARTLVALSGGALTLDAIFSHRDHALGEGRGHGITLKLSLPAQRGPARRR